MASKKESEIDLIKTACKATCTLFNKYLKIELFGIVYGGKEIKHSKISEGVKKALESKRYLDLDARLIDVCYPAIILSGKNANLKFGVLSDDNNLHFGSIICSMGLRYKNYCSNIVRTLLVDPSQELQDIYSLLMETETKVLESMKSGSKLSDVYETAVEFVRAQRPDLVNKLSKIIGFGMGTEFCENALMITAENNIAIETGMTFNVNFGFVQIDNKAAKDSESENVAMFIGDTVVITESGAISLTDDASKKIILPTKGYGPLGFLPKPAGHTPSINCLTYAPPSLTNLYDPYKYALELVHIKPELIGSGEKFGIVTKKLDSCAVVVSIVEPATIAEIFGIQAGWFLLSCNGRHATGDEDDLKPNKDGLRISFARRRSAEFSVMAPNNFLGQYKPKVNREYIIRLD